MLYWIMLMLHTTYVFIIFWYQVKAKMIRKLYTKYLVTQLICRMFIKQNPLTWKTEKQCKCLLLSYGCGLIHFTKIYFRLTGSMFIFLISSIKYLASYKSAHRTFRVKLGGIARADCFRLSPGISGLFKYESFSMFSHEHIVFDF